jgi:hypothetical protein
MYLNILYFCKIISTLVRYLETFLLPIKCIYMRKWVRFIIYINFGSDSQKFLVKKNRPYGAVLAFASTDKWSASSA